MVFTRIATFDDMLVNKFVFNFEFDINKLLRIDKIPYL